MSDVSTVALSNKRDIGLIFVGSCWASQMDKAAVIIVKVVVFRMFLE